MKNKRKHITVATTISASGANNTGGANVVNGFYSELAKYFEISMLYLAPPTEKSRVVQICDGLSEYIIPKTQATEWAIRQLELDSKSKSLYDIACFYYLKDTPQYENTLSRLVSKSDLVMLDRPYLFPTVEMHANGRAIIQRSQNVEYLYKKANLADNEMSQHLLEDVFKIEGRCCNHSAFNFLCSEIDKNNIHEIYGTDMNRLGVLINGIFVQLSEFFSVDDRKAYKEQFGMQDKTIALFIGAGHTPNVEAVKTIINIAKVCTKVIFVIAGDVCNAYTDLKIPSNVRLMGRISERERIHLSHLADVSLNPMYSGSGTNVKMIDYMATGMPVISTTFGVRGISDTSGIIIADTEKQMIDCLKHFELDSQRENIIQNRQMVENEWDWGNLTKKAVDVLSNYMI